MANTPNIKTKIYILGLSAALILCGCENGGVDLSFNTENISSENTVYISETAETIKTAETQDITEITEAEKTTETEITAEITEAPITTEELPYIPDDPFEVREYPDDSIVPAEWIPVYSFAEAAKNFDEIVSADVSNMDTHDAIIALANKNVIFMNYFLIDYFWTADYDHPYYSENYKNPYASDNPNYSDIPLYPILLSPEYYTDIQEIYDLGSEIYINDALNNEIDRFYYDRGKSRKPFMKENGVSYVDVWLLPNWNITPFMLRTYIEIVSETENKCSFIWYRSDWADLCMRPDLRNEPEEGYEFNYHKCNCEAVYENGSWKLSKVYIEGYTLI